MDSTGRASMDVKHHKQGTTVSRGKGKGVPEAQTTMRAKKAEAARHLRPDAEQKWRGEQNQHIIPTETHRNVSWVNDGQGGWKVAEAYDEGMAYRAKRHAQVHRKIEPKQWVDTTVVFHLPKSMCTPVSYVDEDGKTRTRWEAQDEAEMLRYFAEALRYYGDAVVGGQESIHDVHLNLDETTPHIQVHGDTFKPDPKHPGSLRVAASDTWFETTGKGRESRRSKMRRYQQGFKEHMHEAGFDVSLEITDRSTEKLDKPSYEKVQDDRAELDAREQVLDTREATLAQAEADLPRRRRQAEDEGRSQGYAAGLAEGQAEAARLVAEAEANRAATVQALANAQAAQARAQAREEQAAKDAAQAAYDAQVAAQARRAAEQAEAKARESARTKFDDLLARGEAYVSAREAEVAPWSPSQAYLTGVKAGANGVKRAVDVPMPSGQVERWVEKSVASGKAKMQTPDMAKVLYSPAARAEKARENLNKMRAQGTRTLGTSTRTHDGPSL